MFPRPGDTVVANEAGEPLFFEPAEEAPYCDIHGAYHLCEENGG